MNAVQSYRLRLLLLTAVMIGGFLVLGTRLWYEQIHRSEHYRSSISRQSVRRVRLPGLRGRIFTSDFFLLADNAPCYNLVFYLNEMRRSSRRRTVENVREIAQKMSELLNRPDSLTEAQILRHIKTQPGLPLVIYRNLNEIELACTFQMMPQLAGLGIEIEPVRNYPAKTMAAGVIGYSRTNDPAAAADRKDFFYYFGDQIGRSGVERAFDTLAGKVGMPGLRAQPGYELIQVDHLGFVSSRQLEKLDPVNGNNIVLTLDSRAQRIGERLMAGKTGALVLLDADDGAVLAMVSQPGYDLSRTTPVWTADYYRELMDDPRRPMFVRAFQGIYTPGSILKPLVALAALRANYDPETIVDCDGHSVIAGVRIACASRYGHGPLNLIGGIEKSCNDYFIEMGTSIGLDNIARMLHEAGIGENTGLELGGSRGLLPSREVKKQRFKQSWNSYDTALLSIGQGLILLSPVQAARYTAALANGGRLPEVHLLKEVCDEDGKVLFVNQVKSADPWVLPEGALDLVKQGMFQVVNSSGGSGRSAQSSLLTLYGKTGTAEVDTASGRIKNTWFISFTEYQGRRYAMAILVEEGRSGGSDCAPLARQLYEEFLQPERSVDVEI